MRHFFEEKYPGYINVSAQDKGYYLFDEPRKFRLRPDIVVRGEENDANHIVIMDTKWKKLKPDPGMNYGISQADMYQMYAYSKKYHTSEIWLLYPLHPDVSEMNGISFKAVQNEAQNVNVNIFFIDLANYQNSIKELREKIYATKGSTGVLYA